MQETKKMKVCITSYGPTLDSKVQPIFGRCEYFVFVDPVSMESVVEPNPYASCSCEAGVESAKLVIGKGATTVLTAKVGARARQVLDAAGMKVVTVNGETVREVMEAFRMGRSA
jgi:predicted Fe-Mo cluster-binding NifX family protein